MRAEIGSEFWDIPLTSASNNLFDNVTWFASGRAALRAILKQIPRDTGLNNYRVGLPSFLCESMIEPFDKESIPYVFYPVFLDNGCLKCDFSTTVDCNVLLVLDYFGFEISDNVQLPKNKIVIRDLTHSLFVKEYNDADYYFGSLRKWAGFLGAGFAFRKNGDFALPPLERNTFANKREQAMFLKKQYIDGMSDSKEYLKLFHDAENEIDSCQIEECEQSDIEYASHLDIDKLKEARRSNSKILIEGLKDYCLFTNLSENDCPLCVPIIYKDRDELRQYLISNEVYCPIHWPKPLQVNNSFSDMLYEQELSLVCDQRYSKKEIDRIVFLVKTFMENNNA